MKIKIVLVILLISYSVFAFENHIPKNLLITKDITNIQITNENGCPLDIGMACSQTLKDKNHLIFCNYKNLYIMDLNTGKTRILKKPENINNWFPTGVKWCETSQKLYVANYLGKDILVFEFRKDNSISLVKRYTDTELVGPENVDVLNGEYFAVADFDSSKLIFFNKNGKIWSRDIKLAHGVSFTQDKKFILVSSLQNREIYKFDLEGNLVKKIGKLGFNQNEYMWPTSITTSNQGSYVSDAHTGKITFLDDELLSLKTIGGNGLGIDLFNMPYGIIHTEDGLLFVTDTFKNRILKINPKENSILSIYQGFTNKNNIINQVKTTSPLNNSPLGLTYKEYINLSERIKIKFNALEFNTPLNSSYGGFIYNDIVLSLSNTMNYFSSSLYYWVLGKNFKYNNLDFLIIGSPQSSEWLLIYEGIVYPIFIGLDFWIKNDCLVSSQGVTISLTEIASTGLLGIRSYIQAVKNGEPIYEAIQKYLLRMNPLTGYIAKGEKGKEFFKNLMTANNIKEQQKVAKSFLNDIKEDNILYFDEIAIASMVLYDFEALSN